MRQANWPPPQKYKSPGVEVGPPRARQSTLVIPTGVQLGPPRARQSPRVIPAGVQVGPPRAQQSPLLIPAGRPALQLQLHGLIQVLLMQAQGQLQAPAPAFGQFPEGPRLLMGLLARADPTQLQCQLHQMCCYLPLGLLQVTVLP